MELSKNVIKYVLLVTFCAIVVVIFIVLIVLYSRKTEPSSKLRIIIDNDGGADDAMGIFMAFLYEKYYAGPKVIGLTTTNGNTREEQVCINNQRILQIAGRQDVPIYRGAKSSVLQTATYNVGYYGTDGLGDHNYTATDLVPASEENAVEALIKQSKLYEGRLIVVTLGALTNIAMAVKLDPNFVSRLAHLYIGAGRIYEEDPRLEFNANMDAEAYYIVTENSNPDKVTMLQNKASFRFDKNFREKELGSIDTKTMKTLNDFERVSLQRSDAWASLDPAVVAMALRPDLVNQTMYSKNSIILCGDRRGTNTNNYVEKENANIKIVYSLNSEMYKKFLVDIFSKEMELNAN